MKKSFLLLLVFATANLTFGQVKLGTKTLYTPQQNKYTLVPTGYQPIYINFVGRHGARHLTKEVTVSYAYQLLAKADSLSLLTSSGKQLKLMVNNIEKIEKGSVASISATGVEELRAIAKRMFQHQPQVFANQPNLLVATTKKGRTKESAEAFLSGLKDVMPNTVAAVKFNYADDDNLRFYDFSPVYTEFEENGNWQSCYNKLAKHYQQDQISAKFCEKFFAPKFIETLKAENKAKFIDDIYGFYSIVPAINVEIVKKGFTKSAVNFSMFFTADQLTKLGNLGAYQDFLQKGPGTNSNGIQVKIAAPLLADFIKSTDQFIASGDVTANLRFSHAETIAPFAALLNFEGASIASKDFLTFEKVWRAERIIPFSSNIQWIFYKKKNSKELLVKFLLNEKEVRVNGLTTQTFPYYKWSSVRNFYLTKLSTLNYKLSDNPHDYLINVK